MKVSLCAILVTSFLSIAAPPHSAGQDESASTLGEALKRGKASTRFRYRFEADSDREDFIHED